ncbi:hypothetical protein [Coleofasciculus chthonoplastes]|uniref:hypothetical protein n=1 Tax=Coleofasciculus chthonoplastes TaxID=64178 RepID=UPI0032F9D6B2
MGNVVSTTVSSNDDLTLNPNFTGIGNAGDPTLNLLGSGNSLDVGESVRVQLETVVTPPDLTQNYNNQVEATGISPAGTTVNDLSDNEIPTPVNFGELPAIGVAKNATSIAPIGNNRFQVTYDLLVENLGNVSLEDVRLLENLTETFGAGNFTVVNVTSPDQTLTANPDYNGSTIINLLAAGNTLNVNQRALSNGLLGVFNLGSEVSLQSGDEVEYTVYFLSDGGPVVNDVQICDAIPEQTSFVANTIELNEASLTDNEDADQGNFFGELTPVNPPCPNPDNPNGSVLVNVGDVPSTAPNNVGFVRFRVTID